MSFDIQVPLAMEGLEEEELSAIVEVFKSGKLTMADRVEQFENEFAKYLGVNHAVMVNSGSSANLLALEVVTRGSKKVSSNQNIYFAVPAVLWPTTIWPIVQLGYKALVIDTKPGTLQIDFDKLVEAKMRLGDSLVGAFVIHPLGKSLELSVITELRDKYKMIVIEDNCESLGSGNSSRFAGTAGDFGTFSLYFSHHITTVEGGLVVTNDNTFADDLRSMRAHGWTRNRSDRAIIEDSFPNLNKDFLFVTSGYNFRPMEFQGAAGSIQLQKFPKFLRRRIQNAKDVNESLEKSPLRLVDGESIEMDWKLVNSEPEFRGPVSNSWMALPLSTRDESLSLDSIHAAFRRFGIHTRPLLAGDYLSQPAGINSNIQLYESLHNSREMYRRSLMISNHHNLSERQIEHVKKCVENL